MIQKNFHPKDFSPIHYSPEKPTEKGWYVSTWERLKKMHEGKSLIEEGKHSKDFWYWNGEEWYTDDSGESYSKGVAQDRDWFGLNYDTQSGE